RHPQPHHRALKPLQILPGRNTRFPRLAVCVLTVMVAITPPRRNSSPGLPVISSVDPFIAALAACVAGLACHGCVSGALWVSTARPRCTVRLIIGNTLALGLGVWSACTLEALALGPGSGPGRGLTCWIVPLALACVGQLCALVFVAGREPDLPAIAGSALAFAGAVAETQWSTLRTAGGLLDSTAARALAAGGLLTARLLAVAIASVGGTALIIRQLIALYQNELEQRADRSRHDLAEAH